MFEKRKDKASNNKAQAASFHPEDTSFTDSTTDIAQTQFQSRNSAMIGQTIKIKGTVTGNENLIIEGTVEGSVDLSGHDLTIGQTGQVMANLDAKTVKVEGRVEGDISGSEKVIVSKSGRVKGNIVAPRVTLEDGAKFRGSIDMDPGEPAAKVRPSPVLGNADKAEIKEAKQEAS